jgi:outer membrane lipoprotein-sorting protein
MTSLKKLFAYLFIAAGLFAFAGCQDDPAEEAAENLEDRADEIEDAVD